MALIKLINYKIEGNTWLGGNIKITAIFNTAPTSVTITIEDPTGTDVVNDVNMTQESGANRVWTYTYQSAQADQEGDYEVYIKAVLGSNTSFETLKFNLDDADDD